MSDHLDLEHSGLQEVANAVRGEATVEDILSNTSQKRKRDALDQGRSADDMRRSSNKRVSPSAVGEAGDQSNQQDGDAALEALQDYSALHQQGNNENQNGSAEHSNAASTAAAALAGVYPTMTIPQPTDVSFATQGSDTDRNESSFLGDSQQDSFMDNSALGQSSGGRGSGSSKPAVGSDEWHKVRKDNHKEGKL